MRHGHKSQVPMRRASRRLRGIVPTPPKKTPPRAAPTPCVICQGAVQTRASIDACSHSFCLPCIAQWAEHSNTCPLCKRRFYAIEHQRGGQVQRMRVEDTAPVLSSPPTPPTPTSPSTLSSFSTRSSDSSYTPGRAPLGPCFAESEESQDFSSSWSSDDEESSASLSVESESLSSDTRMRMARDVVSDSE